MKEVSISTKNPHFVFILSFIYKISFIPDNNYITYLPASNSQISAHRLDGKLVYEQSYN